MDGKFDSRHPLVGLIDETTRLNGRLKTLFAASRQSVGLGDSELMVLTAVVEAERAPTVAQIGRSMGQARQLVQRAANTLKDAGMIEMVDNPDHKRAPLLKATDQGVAVKRQADATADGIAGQLASAFDREEAIREVTAALRDIRRTLERKLRATN